MLLPPKTAITLITKTFSQDRGESLWKNCPQVKEKKLLHSMLLVLLFAIKTTLVHNNVWCVIAFLLFQFPAGVVHLHHACLAFSSIFFEKLFEFVILLRPTHASWRSEWVRYVGFIHVKWTMIDHRFIVFVRAYPLEASPVYNVQQRAASTIFPRRAQVIIYKIISYDGR